MTFNSPIHILNFSESHKAIYIKRDDLIPLFLGGNKVRKNSFIINSLKDLPDVIITNGGSESNHARVCALMAKQLNIKCHLVLHGERLQSPFMNGNAFFTDSTDCVVEFVEPDFISATISQAECEYQKDGKSVLVIPGGGHSIDGARAYIAAVEELEVEPDVIVFASGTGATHAGILAGVKKRDWNTKVIGISVARQAERGVEAIDELYQTLCKSENIEYSKSDIIFLDEYTFGGYSRYNNELITFLKNSISVTGVPFDPIYTGKALYGLNQLILSNEISAISKVLFWHTGGLLNLQSSKAI